MRMRMVSLVVSAALCSSCAAASRELEKVEPVSINAAMIGGSVVDSASQQPIVGAEIVLLTANGDAVSDQQSKTFTFAPRGQFRFDDVRPGSYSLRVSATGYQSVTRPVAALKASERYTLEFALRRAN